MVKKLTFFFVLLFFIFLFQNTASAQIVVINKATKELALYQNEEHVRTFSVGIGKGNLVPEGRFKIVQTRENPPYFPERIPGGHRNNPLGLRWLGLDVGNTEGMTYGIHGTNTPSRVGRTTDVGNITMLNEDVRWLYDRVGVSTEVLIVNSNQTFDQLVKTPTPVATLERSYSLFINKRQYYPNDRPVLHNGFVHVPLRFVFEQLGYYVQWDPKEQRLILTNGEDRIQIVLDETWVRINGTNLTISQPVTRIHNRVYIPTTTLVEILGEHAEVKINGDIRKVEIDYEQPDNSYTFYINDRKQNIKELPLVVDEKLYLPAEFMAKTFGAKTRYISKDKKLIITRNELILELIIGSNQAYFNNSRILMDDPFIMKNGYTLLPAEFAGLIFNIDIVWEPQFRTVDIKHDMEGFVEIFFNNDKKSPYTGYVIDGEVHFPLNFIYQKLDINVGFQENEGRIVLESNGKVVEMHLGSKSALVDERMVRLSHAPRMLSEEHENIVVPIKFIVETLKGDPTFVWNKQKKTVDVTFSGIKRSIAVYFNKKRHLLSRSPMELNNVVYLPAFPILEKFGMSLNYDSKEKKLTAKRNELSVELIADSKLALINGEREVLREVPVVEGGYFFIPAYLLESLFNAQLSWDYYEKKLDVNYGLTEYVDVYFNFNTRDSVTGYIVDNELYLPINVVKDRMNADVNILAGNRLEIRRGANSIEMLVESYSAFLNNRLIRITVPPRHIDNQILVPMEFVVKSLGQRIEYQKEHAKVYIQ